MNLSPSETDLIVQDQMHTMWCNFITNEGSNIGMGVPSDVFWGVYSPEGEKVFHFNEMDNKEPIDELMGYW